MTKQERDAIISEIERIRNKEQREHALAYAKWHLGEGERPQMGSFFDGELHGPGNVELRVLDIMGRIQAPGRIRKAINRAKIYTLTVYNPSRNSSSAVVRVFACKGGTLREITGDVAYLFNEKIAEHSYGRGIQTDGYGYSRAQHVVDGIGYKIGRKLTYEEI